MKKSGAILITLTIALAACRSEVKDDWVSGNDDPNARDTVINNQHYRSHFGLFYLMRSGMISPSSYQGASLSQISSPGYSQSRVSRGGFGSRSRVSS